ncbi:hypothetical protein M434DRAFT_382725 [Hypoxylon sp. CO27-5]|nr:hypothetical protein M434DRAFT_382725 [Hypoxylon sp. CO27-5]
MSSNSWNIDPSSNYGGFGHPLGHRANKARPSASSSRRHGSRRVKEESIGDSDAEDLENIEEGSISESDEETILPSIEEEDEPARTRPPTYVDTATQTTPGVQTPAPPQPGAAAQAGPDIPMQAPAQPVAAPQAPRINHPRARGHIDGDGKFCCECGMPPITNASHHISSHLSNWHKADSARMKKRARDPRVCGICHRTCQSFNNFQSHIRSNHDVRGSTTAMWRQWQSTAVGDVIQVRSG